ncbi:hypothetical protein AB0K74_24260, partial [Streptomyces sp. NPDC056159]|uniref:hypothetical protein n=1 Tax=Streptomyces sp. NPDC056159 TaxID=3155537 RepID=UPI00342B9E8A
MSLTFGPDRQTREFACGCCSAPIERAWNFIHSDGAPYAVYFANCYHHRDQDHDAWIDVIFGTWGVGSDQWDDHVSFACRRPAARLSTWAGCGCPAGPTGSR